MMLLRSTHAAVCILVGLALTGCFIVMPLGQLGADLGSDGSAIQGESSLTVASVYPPADSSDVPLTSVVTAKFSAPVGLSSLVNPVTNTSVGSFVLKDEDGKDVPTTLTYNPLMRTATLTPVERLAPGRRYTVTVRDARDESGAALTEAVSWTFSTTEAPSELALAVASTTPPAGAVDVWRSGAVSVTFDRPLAPESVVNPTTNSSTGAFVLKTPAGANVAGTVTYNASNSTVTFVPTAYLAANVTYTASIKDVRTSAGLALDQPYSWTFSTGAKPDVLPSILGTSPANDASEVARDASIRVSFSEPVTGIAAGTFVVRDTSTNAVLTARSLVFDPIALVATFRPQTNFSPRTTYRVTVQDVAGVNGVLLPQHTFSFTTGDQPNTTPSITSQTPAPGSAGVPRDARVQVVFDSPVAGIAAATFVLRNTLTNTLVTAESVGFNNSTRTAQFQPSAFLAANTSYTVTLRNITSVDGVPLPETSWQFTTSSGPDNVAPAVTAAGLTVRANCANEATLSWSPASDDVTAQSEISYQIYQARSTGGYDLNSPTYSVGPGVTSFRATGLSRGTSYFYTVRAVDASSNRSTGFTERSLTTPTVLGCANNISIAGGPGSVVSSDFNSDGSADLAIGCVQSSTVAILLGNGNGTFSPAATPSIAAGGQPVDVAAADLNNDGRPDLIVASRSPGSIRVFLGNGDGTFAAALTRAVAGARSIAVGEFNNPVNSNLDVAVATGDDISVLSGNGDGTFGATILRLTLAGAADAHAVTAADFDGDGLADIGVCYAVTDQAAAWLNSTPSGGAFAFTTPTTATNRLFAVQNAPSAVLSPDLDGDGWADLAVLNAATPSVTIRVSSVQAANLFPGGENTALTAGTLPVAIAARDLDGDGLADLVTANRGAAGVSTLLNLAGTSLFTVESEDAGAQPSDVELADFNGDGRPDVAVTNVGDNTVSILLNVP